MLSDGKSGSPLVTVGVPVYNGESFLARTLDGLRSQTVRELRIVVSDNASTDRTCSIVAEARAADPRIELHRFDTNRGPAANYNKVAEGVTTPYFMWAAADDVHAPAFVERCLELLETDAGAVLACPQTQIIDDEDSPVRVWDYVPDVSSADPADRFRSMLMVDHHRHGAYEIFGLMRTRALRALLPQGAFSRSDSVVLAGLALRGRFGRVPEPLFLNRDHTGRSVRTEPTRGYRGKSWLAGRIGTGPVPGDEWWDPSRRDVAVWPEWRLMAQYARLVREAPLSDAERRRCRRVLLAAAVHYGPKLARDVLLNTELGLRRAADLPRRLRAGDRSTAPV